MTELDYAQACVYLRKSYERHNKKGFEVMRGVLAQLGRPHEKIKTVHIAGTNGKGSACAYLTNILIHAGYKVGTFISPHLIKYNERFLIDNEQISDEDLARHVGLVADATERVLGKDKTMSFFEIFTVVCFNYFYERNVDVAVVETGLGGRLDPTNVIDNPALSIITSIGYDHMNILGEDINVIAGEKAGIIKKNCPSVLYCNQKQVYNTFIKQAGQMNSKLYYSNEDYEVVINRRDLTGTYYSAKIGRDLYNDVFIKLLGDYQVYNSTNMIFAVKALTECGFDISRPAVYSGLADTTWVCRAEIARENPIVMLDGAHNMDGVTALVKICADYFPGKDIYLVMGALSDKEYGGMAACLSKIARAAVYTRPDSAKAADPADLLAYNKSADAAYLENDCVKAYQLALRLAGRDGVVLVAGSLYLVGAVKKYMMFEGGKSTCLI